MSHEIGAQAVRAKRALPMKPVERPALRPARDNIHSSVGRFLIWATRNSGN